MDAFFIENAKAFRGQVVRLKGWVHNKRSSGKIKFLVLRDGTGFIQGILIPGQTEPSALLAFEKLSQESSVDLVGELKPEARAQGGFELLVHSLSVLQFAEPYPISPKEHGVEFLMSNRHLWLRSQRQWAVLRVRSYLINAVRNFFHKRQFITFDAPILSASSCEGTSTLFSTEYFEEQAYLTQSGQLYGEAGAFAFNKVLVFGPTFRAEKSKTRKHLTEFWMLEPEMAFSDMYDAMHLGEDLVFELIQGLLKDCQTELKILERKLEPLKKIQKPFPQISYDEALLVLKKRGMELTWGEDFGAPHEAALGEEFAQPVFVHHMPSQIKAFYFKQVDSTKQRDAKLGAAPCVNGRYALGCDLIAPEGFGEIIGGGQREEDASLVLQRMKDHGLKQADYEWYLDLRRFGSVPHAGFGLGLERFVAWMCGLEHIRESLPFPRLINHLRP